MEAHGHVKCQGFRPWDVRAKGQAGKVLARRLLALSLSPHIPRREEMLERHVLAQQRRCGHAPGVRHVLHAELLERARRAGAGRGQTPRGGSEHWQHAVVRRHLPLFSCLSLEERQR